jgi:hypothetical protein
VEAAQLRDRVVELEGQVGALTEKVICPAFFGPRDFG